MNTNKFVLVVDDTEHVREGSVMFIESLGFRCLQAENGALGLITFQQRKHEICAIYSDFQMPEMNGLELLKAVREIDKKIPFVIASGKIKFEDDAIQALMDGAQAFVSKPLDSQAIRKVSEILKAA